MNQDGIDIPEVGEQVLGQGYQPADAPRSVMGGQPASVAFYGEAPDMVSGVMRLDARIPTNVPSGTR
jgi:uncharacterized protein (TIGR03437 family)